MIYAVQFLVQIVISNIELSYHTGIVELNTRLSIPQ